MSRLKPYSTNQESWNTILQKNLTIPMNQREYSWGTIEVTKFLDDIFKIFEENKYVEKMGSIINLNYNNVNDIYDGQQRILTIITILNVMGNLSLKLKNKINQLLTIDTDIEDLTKKQLKLKENEYIKLIPKISCINPYDMKALVNMFNDIIESWVSYLKDDNSEFGLLEEEDIYTCKHCDVKISRKSDFITHINKKHGYKILNDSKLYNSFIEIYNYFIIKKYDERKLIELYKFILNDIDIQYYDCNDPEYVSRIFDWENNRGRTVESLDIIKNPILVRIPEDKRFEIYNKWEELKHQKNKVYKQNFGQKIFDIAIQLYNNEINRVINHEKLFKPIIENKSTYTEIQKFFKIVEDLFEIMEKISDDKFGRLINNTSRVCLNWEAYMWCFLPIFYKINTVDVRLIKLMTKWYFRNLQFKTRTFNSLCYSNNFIKITNKVLQNKNHDYYKEIENCLKTNKSNDIIGHNYYDALYEMSYKSTSATHLLLFLETCINTDLHSVPLDYTLEHILSQKDKSNLLNQSLIDNIGNLTLLEGKNSANGHRGNSSLGSRKYERKNLSYKDSSSKISRDLYEKYDSFNENDIISRNKNIVELLDKYTFY